MAEALVLKVAAMDVESLRWALNRAAEVDDHFYYAATNFETICRQYDNGEQPSTLHATTTLLQIANAIDAVIAGMGSGRSAVDALIQPAPRPHDCEASSYSCQLSTGECRHAMR